MSVTTGQEQVWFGLHRMVADGVLHALEEHGLAVGPGPEGHEEDLLGHAAGDGVPDGTGHELAYFRIRKYTFEERIP